MRNVLAIARKEWTVYFTTPWAWVVFTAMSFMSSYQFLTLLAVFKEVQERARVVGWQRLGPDAAMFRNLTDGVITQMWQIMLIVALFAAPVLSMRLFAEERKQKTIELLFTLPLRPWEIVLGKYLGAMGAMKMTFGITIIYPLVLAALGSSESGSALEWSTVLLGYGALLLWSASAVAIGMFISALTESQVLAGFITVAVLFIWLLIGAAATGLEGLPRDVINYVNIGIQLDPLFKGVLDLKPLAFFGSVVALAMYFTTRAVEAQRWT